MKDIKKLTDDELEREIYANASVSERLSIKDQYRRELADEEMRRLSKLSEENETAPS